MTIKQKNYQYVSVSNITFCISNDEGNILKNKDGTIKKFYCNKLNYDYLCEDITVEDLEEIKDE